MSLRTIAIPIAAALLLGVAGCATTTFTSTWKAPDAAPLSAKRGDLVVAMVMSKVESTRRSAEDMLSTELQNRGLRPIPSFTLIPTDQVDDKEKALVAVKGSGAVAVIAMRPLAVDKEQTYVPPSYMGPGVGGPYGGWGPYYSYGWSAAYSPGYVMTNTVVRIEVLVFDLRQDKLLWAGQSKTTNPEELHVFIGDLVQAAADEMIRAGVIVPQKT
jgi:hypothetical protein